MLDASGRRAALRWLRPLTIWSGLLGIALSSAASGPASEEQLQRLDGSLLPLAEIERRIPRLMAKVWLPGMSVLVVRDGAIAYRRSFGVRDVATGEPISSETSFAGLSFSKTITAYATMRLVERGALDLDRPLHAYLSKPLPEYESYLDLSGDDRYRSLTARHVLSHTTGWPNWRWITESGKLSFLFEPGTRHSYSGEGFAYLQLALEELTGLGFAELAHREVFAPLDMSRSSMVWQAEYAEDYAEDHDFLGRSMRRDRRDDASAAGSLQTTIADYGRFLIGVMNAQGLRPTTRDAMLTRQVRVRHARMFGPRMFEESADDQAGLGWALGWGCVDTPYGRMFFHTGNDRGSANYSIVFPDLRAAVVLMGNSNRLEGIAGDVVELLTADGSSPFEFLGYSAWDEPYQGWLRTLAESGVAAGRLYWESLGDRRREHGLDQEDVFAQGGEATAHFRPVEEALEFHRWRRELFPASSRAVRDQVRLLLSVERSDEALAALEGAVGQELLATELEWFVTWARAIARPTSVPAERLRTLAGEYEVRRFELRDGRLFYGRDETPSEEYQPLTALSQDTFVLPTADSFRLRFERDDQGRAVRVRGLYEGGREDSNVRTSPPPE